MGLFAVLYGVFAIGVLWTSEPCAIRWPKLFPICSGNRL
jgi:hypothetical protein